MLMGLETFHFSVILFYGFCLSVKNRRNLSVSPVCFQDAAIAVVVSTTVSRVVSSTIS